MIEDQHRALGDAVATSELFLAILNNSSTTVQEVRPVLLT